ncbi:MAG: DUF4292 domain-containing protein [bacterium]
MNPGVFSLLNTGLRWLMLALLVLAAPACAPKALVRPGSVPSAQELLERLQAQDSGIRTLQATGSLKWTREGERQSVDQALILSRPGSLRLEALSPMGPSVLSMSISRGVAQVYVPGEKRALSGAASDKIMERLFALPMKVDEVLAVLCGRPPLCARVSSVEARAEAGVWILELDCQDSGLHQQLRLDPAHGDPMGMVVLSPSGQLLVSISWSGFRKVDDLRLPTEIRVELPAKASRVELRLRELDPNLPIPEERFRLEIPKEIQVEPLS